MSDAPDPPTARPSRPELQGRPAPGRPARPVTGAALPVTEPGLDEATIVAQPPAAPRPPRPSTFAGRVLRQTLLPPSLVLAIGFIGLGVAYLRQPPDAALRELPPAAAWACFALGGLSAATAGLLALSLRRR